jgi:hypothetical protein
MILLLNVLGLDDILASLSLLALRIASVVVNVADVLNIKTIIVVSINASDDHLLLLRRLVDVIILTLSLVCIIAVMAMVVINL